VAESGFFHQWRMPEVPPPHSLLTSNELMRKLAEDPQIPAKVRSNVKQRIDTPFPMEIRPIDQMDFVYPRNKRAPNRRVWMRAQGPLSEDPHIHQCVVAYMSDYALISTSLLPHGIPSSQLQMASLDHAMWFHEPFRADEYLLYDLESPKAMSSRALASGRFYTTDGRLVVSTAQEGLVRMRVPSPAHTSLSPMITFDACDKHVTDACVCDDRKLMDNISPPPEYTTGSNFTTVSLPSKL